VSGLSACDEDHYFDASNLIDLMVCITRCKLVLQASVAAKLAELNSRDGAGWRRNCQDIGT
jgi:hypothetical protein